MIYIDSSVALARLLFERHAPPPRFWEQRLASSRLLEYEVWNRVHAYHLSDSSRQAARTLLLGIDLFELDRLALSRALEPWPTPLRILDALHLATMDYLRSEGEPVDLASYDTRLTAAAAAMGFPLAAL